MVTLVMYAPVRRVDTSVPLYPIERYSEILRSKNERVRAEKYLVWKLLEKAVTDCFNLEFTNLQFTKTANGKWICPDFYFSLSHTDGLVCVAVSKCTVGIDVEIVHDISDRVAGRILTDRERKKMESAPIEERNDFLLRAWVNKESIFKKRGDVALLPSTIETEDAEATVEKVTVDGRPYIISVCCNGNEILYEYTEEI